MPNTYACKLMSNNPNVPIFPPRVCTLVLFIIISMKELRSEVMTSFAYCDVHRDPLTLARMRRKGIYYCPVCVSVPSFVPPHV